MSTLNHLIIAKTYQPNDLRERDRQCDNFQNFYIFVACHAGCRAGFHASDVTLVVALVYGESRLTFEVFQFEININVSVSSF